MRRTALQGTLGERLVGAAVLKMGFLYRDVTTSDMGIDGVIETTRLSGREREATGREIAVQVKTGNSVVKRTRYGYSLYSTTAHAKYWLGHSLPVIIVHCELDTERLRWARVSKNTLRKTAKGFSIDIAEESNFISAAEDLARLADNSVAEAKPSHSFLLVLGDSGDIKGSNDQIGLTALETAEAASRGSAVSIRVEFENQAELVASIDSLGDRQSATDEERRIAVEKVAILDTYERKAERLRRALALLLTHPSFTEALGFGDAPIGDDWLALALRSAADRLFEQSELQGNVLAAWPTRRSQALKVVFGISQEQLSELMSRKAVSDAFLQLGEQAVFDLPRSTFFARYLPALALRLTYYADDHKIDDAEALSHIGVDLHSWWMGYD